MRQVIIDNTPYGQLKSLLGAMNLDAGKTWLDEACEGSYKLGYKIALENIYYGLGISAHDKDTQIEIKISLQNTIEEFAKSKGIDIHNFKQGINYEHPDPN